MLETKNLVKIYKPKKGVPVKALDGVSIKFPDTGMVFLLGKSGCGKSTLLNLLGGLDKYDSGEIIIKGVSSKSFKQRHFDSYRNTYVGFIFQEYNILEEFTVGANIALALELQGRKATDAEINDILNQVDLQGYGNRRPNELSGGQKQRVAIARALVKSPKIIMADEPSGALDSNTGKQVFETLKRLSETKLVIVVSHDREFATEYADRIIELADGRVIDDISVLQSGEQEAAGLVFEGETAKISAGYHLTEDDRKAINDYIDKLQSGVNLEFNSRKTAKKFAATDESTVKNSDNSSFKLIKSKLSLKHAFKFGASGLKHKKFRLVMTILLSCISFILFGLVNTFSSYNHTQACTDSIYDSGVTYATLSKEVLKGEGIDSYWMNYGNKISKKDLEKLSKESGVEFHGVVNTPGFAFRGFSFEMNLGDTKNTNLQNLFSLYSSSFSGMVEITESDIDKLGYKMLSGRLPDGTKNEIAISDYIFEAFKMNGYREYDPQSGIKNDGEAVKIQSYSDIIGKTLFVGDACEYTVTGVIDTNFDFERYEPLTDIESHDDSGEIWDYVLYTEFNSAVSNSYSGMMLVGEGGTKRFINENPVASVLNSAELTFGFDSDSPFYVSSLMDFSSIDKNDIIWLNGERAALSDKEIIITLSSAERGLNAVIFDEYGEPSIDFEALSKEVKINHYDYSNDESSSVSGVKIVGVLDNLNNPEYSVIGESLIMNTELKNKYLPNDGEYNLALGAMPKDKSDIKKLVSYCYTEREGIRYALNNPACFELDSLNEIIIVLADVFLYIGIGFAVFASVLLSNFIATSISYKKQEIGILRAIGSRGNDVFRIFFAESFIIAMINFVLSCAGTWFITSVINTAIRDNVGLLVTILNFGIKQISVIFAVSLAVAAIASFLPVKRIASKRPIDAIRNR